MHDLDALNVDSSWQKRLYLNRSTGQPVNRHESKTGLSGNKKVAAFLKKSGAKNFCLAGPVTAKPARPSSKKFFCFFLFTKRSLPLRLDMNCPKTIRL
jgi:hypothetical protein